MRAVEGRREVRGRGAEEELCSSFKLSAGVALHYIVNFDFCLFYKLTAVQQHTFIMVSRKKKSMKRKRNLFS